MRSFINFTFALIAFVALFLVLPFLVYSVNKYFHHDRIEQMIESKVKAECLK
jgi:ATP/ADP translocase